MVAVVSAEGFCSFMIFFDDFVDFIGQFFFCLPESWSMVVTLTGSLVVVHRGFCWFCHIWPRQMAICRGGFFF